LKSRNQTLFSTKNLKNMLRRPPTAITLTTEDLIKYDETRAQQLAQQRAQAAAAENAQNMHASQQKQVATSTSASAEKAQARKAADRIMGSGSGR